MKTLILAEHNGKQLNPSVLQAVTAAHFWQIPIEILVVGSNIDAIAQQAAAITGVNRVLQTDANHLAHQMAEDVAELIVSIAPEYQVIMSAHSSFSRNILPRAAALLDVDMISDALEIYADNTYLRTIYSGSVNATVGDGEAFRCILPVHLHFEPCLARREARAYLSAIAARCAAAHTASFQHHNFVSRNRQFESRRQTSKASADHHHVG